MSLAPLTRVRAPTGLPARWLGMSFSARLASSLAPKPDGPTVSAAWLKKHIGSSSNLVVLDASWYLPGEKRDTSAEFLKSHILNARFFDIDKISDHSTNLPHMLPTPDQFAREVGNLGISRDDCVVVYDTAGIFSSCRVYWTFKAFGHASVAVLDGGFPTFVREGGPTESGQPNFQPKQYAQSTPGKIVRNYKDVIKAIATKDELILDARPQARFDGTAPEPRPIPSGHMPGSLSVPFKAVLSPQGTFLPPADLVRVFCEKGVDLRKPIITSCGSGVTAAVVYVAAEIARAEANITGNLSLYDGSWSEYASISDSPIQVAK